MSAVGGGTSPAGPAGTGPGRPKDHERLTTHEAATEARCSRSTIYRALWSGDLHSDRPEDQRGVTHRIHIDSLAAWLCGQDSAAACPCARARRHLTAVPRRTA
ncbi:MAG: helix-turn-helix domain-containing protein [Pseudonocardiaceae bacterium]